MVKGEFLASYPVLRTDDLGQARSEVAERYCDHRLELGRGRDLSVRHNHVRGAHLSLNYLRYGGDVCIDPGELRDFYLLQLPLSGAARVSHRAEEVDVSVERGTILNPDRPTTMAWDRDCAKLMLQIDLEFLTRVAEEELSAPLPGPIRFDPTVDLSSAAGQHMRDLVVTAARAVEAGVFGIEAHSLASVSVERDLAQMLLALQPSNISHLLQRDYKPGTSRQLRKAVEFIHAKYFENIRLADIARAAGAHPRTLQAAFRETLGVTPITYLRDLRLDMARYRLTARSGRESVTDVAFGCGYSHLGRFSRDYCARFGNLPSAVP